MQHTIKKNKAGRPQGKTLKGPSFALAEWLNQNLNSLTSLTNEEIATKLGYTSPNIISMWRTGRTRVPLDRLPGLCEILNVDISYLLPLWIEQYGKDKAYSLVLHAIKNSVSDSELQLVEAVRETSNGRNFILKPDADKGVAELIELV